MIFLLLMKNNDDCSNVDRGMGIGARCAGLNISETADLGILHTAVSRLCMVWSFYNLKPSHFRKSVSTEASGSRSWLTRVEPDDFSGCCGPSAIRTDVQCILRFCSAYHGCTEWLFVFLEWISLTIKDLFHQQGVFRRAELPLTGVCFSHHSV